MQWTISELETLKTINNTTLSKDQLKCLFPYRTIGKIRKKANKMNIKIKTIRDHPNKWTQFEDNIIKNLYKHNPQTVIKTLNNRSISAIKQRALNIHKIKIRKPWSKEEILYLKNNYTFSSKNELMLNLDRTWESIKQKANSLSLYSELCPSRNSKIAILNDNSHNSLYWIGFILADGHINNNKRLVITTSIKDKDHIFKFGDYVKCNNITINEKIKYPQISIKMQDSINIPKICEKYNINSNKTKNPPNIRNYKLDDDQFLSLFIGFIDGDGSICYISYRKTCSIRIKIDSSWLDNLKYFEDRLYIINYQPRKNTLSKIRNHGYAELTITNQKMINFLKQQSIDLKLPILNRKWDKI